MNRFMVIKLFAPEGYEPPHFFTTLEHAKEAILRCIYREMQRGVYYEPTPRYDAEGLNGFPIWEYSELHGGTYGLYHWQIWCIN